VHHRRPAAARGHRAGPREERGLNHVTFVGSFPAAGFHVRPTLPEVAVLGRSNVGKSSLINSLVGRRALAHTSKTPGKTRTCNVYNVEERFYLVDLPGYGYARAPKAARSGFRDLLRGYLSTRETLAGVVWLLDVRRDPSPDDRTMADMLVARGVPTLAAITKADKVARGRRRDRISAILSAVELEEEQCVVTSSRTGEGVEELRNAIDALIDRSA
jgi:GTP-binding protein